MNSIKASYEKRTIGTNVELVVAFSNEKTGLLALLFNGEFDSFYDWIYENVSKSLEDSMDREIAGNICKLVISKDYAIIYNLMSNDDSFFKIETLDLKELMCEWKKEFDSIK